LVVDEELDDLAVLNFASARKVGGGFLRGAKAQEEDLVRSCGLYRCLEAQPDYYQANQSCESMLYTDHIIYSPGVPWFRSENGDLLKKPFLASIITAPAPNAKEYLKKNPGGRKAIRDTLERRARYVLSIARDNGHRSLLLGAWGCGVFGNNPHEVARVFMSLLKSKSFKGQFERVEFAVFDRTPNRDVYQAFFSTVNR
jgi:uncharacterized protein (TIGR02452 family)